jgi:CheY-like chemotaxis protein
MEVLLPSLEHPGFEPAPESAEIAPEGTEEIFLVEDEPVLCDILRRILSGLGYQVRQFTNSAEAWDYFKDNSDRFDLALLDHNMPVITGVELAARINRLQPRLPIILFTGMNINLLRQDAEKAGVRTLINKPLNRIELALTIRKVLDEVACQA